jgi:acetyltransferase-like isoleucine patch superfamily enzyme
MRLRRLEERLRARLWGLRRGVSVGRGVRVGRYCRLIVERGSRVVLEDAAGIDDGTTIAAYSGGCVQLGAGSFAGHHCTVAARQSVEIGAGAFLAELVSVRDHDHAVGVPPGSGQMQIAPVSIGADAWVGAKATVVRGATIGAGAVVGANAVVRGEVAPRTLVAGVPAEFVRLLEPGAP